MKSKFSGLLSAILLAVLLFVIPTSAESFRLQDALAGIGCMLQPGQQGMTAQLQTDTSASDLEVYGLTDFASFTRFNVLPVDDNGQPTFDGTYIGAFQFDKEESCLTVYDRFRTALNDAYQYAGKAQNNPFDQDTIAGDNFAGHSWENDTEKMAIYHLDSQILIINGNPKTVTWLQQNLKLFQETD